MLGFGPLGSRPIGGSTSSTSNLYGNAFMRSITSLRTSATAQFKLSSKTGSISTNRIASPAAKTYGAARNLIQVNVRGVMSQLVRGTLRSVSVGSIRGTSLTKIPGLLRSGSINSIRGVLNLPVQVYGRVTGTTIEATKSGVALRVFSSGLYTRSISAIRNVSLTKIPGLLRTLTLNTVRSGSKLSVVGRIRSLGTSASRAPLQFNLFSKFRGATTNSIRGGQPVQPRGYARISSINSERGAAYPIVYGRIKTVSVMSSRVASSAFKLFGRAFGASLAAIRGLFLPPQPAFAKASDASQYRVDVGDAVQYIVLTKNGVQITTLVDDVKAMAKRAPPP